MVQRDDHALDALFAPPPGCHGTHMALCAMTADVETLDRAVSVFTGHDRLTRAASGWPRAVLMLDASQPLAAAAAVPGLIRLAHDDAAIWQARTSLLHAKVALLAFADQPFDLPTSFRLIVSTGNWTRASWAEQSLIDMYWRCDWQCQAQPSQEGEDIKAAFDFLDRLMSGLYGASLRAFSDALPWWEQWREQMAHMRSRSPASRFIHSLDKTLYAQIKPRFEKADFHTIIAGSGFFEQAGAQVGAMPSMLANIESMTPQAKERHLVFNPTQAGALAGWLRATTSGRGRGTWKLHLPIDPFARRARPGRTQLHAKFIVGLSRRINSADGKLGALYLGSGNLSCRGLMSHALMQASAGEGKAGSIEAGIVTTEPLLLTQLWQSLACGDLMDECSLPELEEGSGDPLHQPLPPPPVLLARHLDSELHFVRSAGSAQSFAFQFRLAGDTIWQDVGQTQQVFEHIGPTPPFVVVRRHAEDAETFEVPVMSAAGTLCRQPPPQLGADDVLEGLQVFPDIPAYAIDAVDDGSSEVVARPSSNATARLNYPLRWLATVIEAIARRQSTLTPTQFPLWVSQVRMLLLEQVTPEDLAQVRALRLSLFPALLEDGFRPAWLRQLHPMHESYAVLISQLQARWSEPATAPNGESHGH